MSTLSRCAFLTTFGATTLGYAALSKFVPRNPQTPVALLPAEEAPFPPLPPGFQPTTSTSYFGAVQGGNVVSISASEIVITNGPGGVGGYVTLLLTPQTVFNDGTWVSEIPVQVGDHLYARGQPLGNFRMEVKDYSVNPGIVIGQVIATEGGPNAPFRLRASDRYDELHQTEYRGVGHPILIDPRSRIYRALPRQATVASQPDFGRLAHEGPVELSTGQSVMVTGRVHEGLLLAVNVWPG